MSASYACKIYRRHGQDKTALSGLVRVGGVNDDTIYVCQSVLISSSK